MERLVSFKNHLNETLAGTLHEPNRPTDKGVVLAHCFTCTRHTRILTDIAAKLSFEGCTVLRFDFSGNGQSEGLFIESSYSKHIREMKIASDFLSQRGVSRIGFAGHSMGASIAALAAAESAVKAVCGLAGRLSGLEPLRFLSPLQKEELETTGSVSFLSRGRTLTLPHDFFSDAEKYDLKKILTDFTGKLLIIHGDQDEIIPVEEAYAAHRFNPARIETEIIPGADHMFSNESHRRQITEKTVSWLMNQLENQRAG